jgi:DnaK suppressor protein
MADAKKKTPDKKKKAPATIKVSKQITTKKAAKAKVSIRAKIKPKAEIKANKKTIEVKAKTKIKKGITKAGIEPKGKSRRKVKIKTRVEVTAKAKKAIDWPSKKKTTQQKRAVVQEPAKKALTAKKSAAPKKGTAAAPAADRFRGLKSMLIAKRDALLNEAKQEIKKYVSGENRQLVDTAIDEADWAAVEISEDINLKRLSAQRQFLNDVEECLRKLNEGTYGICEDCGEEISEKRLHVIPTATLCIDCKEQREKMAILDQESDI